jgi:hypothetical protein
MNVSAWEAFPKSLSLCRNTFAPGVNFLDHLSILAGHTEGTNIVC